MPGMASPFVELEVGPRTVKVTNPDKVLFPDPGITKRELVDYYLAVGDGVLWVALPLVPDWRWMLGRSDSPWYPTMRLFRQERPGDWEGVFHKIRAALRERFADEDAASKLD